MTRKQMKIKSPPHGGLYFGYDLPELFLQDVEQGFELLKFAFDGFVGGFREGLVASAGRPGEHLDHQPASDEVDHDRISARLNAGVLRVELPRTERSEPRRIQVSTG